MKTINYSDNRRVFLIIYFPLHDSYHLRSLMVLPSLVEGAFFVFDTSVSFLILYMDTCSIDFGGIISGLFSELKCLQLCS